jgi:uncharacterized SAM-binding protein YcdF (DUF218 family)
VTSSSPGTVRHKRRRRALFIAVGLTLLVLAAAARAGLVLVVVVPVSAPDAIISLASHEWERLPTAARHARAHADAQVLLTVPQSVTPYNCHDCANRTARLQALGIEAERVRLLILTSGGTHGEAVATREFARREGVQRLLIVTSPYHTRRALAVFRKVFEGTGVTLGVQPAIDDSVARPGRWWSGGYDRAYVVYEWAALIYYAVKHGVPLTL